MSREPTDTHLGQKRTKSVFSVLLLHFQLVAAAHGTLQYRCLVGVKARMCWQCLQSILVGCIRHSQWRMCQPQHPPTSQPCPCVGLRCFHPNLGHLPRASWRWVQLAVGAAARSTEQLCGRSGCPSSPSPSPSPRPLPLPPASPSPSQGGGARGRGAHTGCGRPKPCRVGLGRRWGVPDSLSAGSPLGTHPSPHVLRGAPPPPSCWRAP